MALARAPVTLERARRMGISDANRIYKLEDLAQGDVMFAATGVTAGSFLGGVTFFGGAPRLRVTLFRALRTGCQETETTGEPG